MDTADILKLSLISCYRELLSPMYISRRLHFERYHALIRTRAIALVSRSSYVLSHSYYIRYTCYRTVAPTSRRAIALLYTFNTRAIALCNTFIIRAIALLLNKYTCYRTL